MHLKDLVVNEEINFNLITFKPIRNLLEKILKKDPNERASLSEILKDEWVTNNGKEKQRLDMVEFNRETDFGNLKRALRTTENRSLEINANENSSQDLIDEEDTPNSAFKSEEYTPSPGLKSGDYSPSLGLKKPLHGKFCLTPRDDEQDF
jgi:serine/threonine protein kinase